MPGQVRRSLAGSLPNHARRHRQTAWLGGQDGVQGFFSLPIAGSREQKPPKSVAKNNLPSLARSNTLETGKEFLAITNLPKHSDVFTRQ